jgi:putative endonuclease
MTASHELGRWGEAVAAGWLEARGWRIVARNFRYRHKELDLVARRGRTVAFIEVKTRRDRRFGHPAECVTRAKRRELERAATFWIARHGRPREEYRFDLVTVQPRRDGTAEIDYLENAWQLGT